MKIFLFLTSAFLVAGTTAQQNNVTVDLQNLLNEIDQNAASFIDSFVANLQGAVDAARTLLQFAVNALNTLLTFTANLVSPSFANMVQNSLSAVVDSLIVDFNSDSLRNATAQYFQTAREVYRSRLQNFISTYNSTSGIYQCWNISRPQIREVLRKFLNTTATQIRPFIVEFRNNTDIQYRKAEANFTYYQRNAPACFYLFQPIRSRNCREAYVSRLSS